MDAPGCCPKTKKMKPIKYYPPQVENPLAGFVNEFFNREIGSFLGGDSFVSQPMVNILETASGYIIELAAPGLEKKDFNLQIDGRTLLLSANKEGVLEEGASGKILRKEFNFATFSRRFRLPNGTVAENIEAVYAHGVLTINIPKAVEALKKEQTVEIQ